MFYENKNFSLFIEEVMNIIKEKYRSNRNQETSK